MSEPLPIEVDVLVVGAGQAGLGAACWVVELLLPRTDAGVLVQALVVLAAFALLFRPARRAGLLQLLVGGLVFVVGLFALRASH